jgi:hypothetical protein
LLFSVADPNPGSGIGAFLTPGSRIRNRFFPDPGSQTNNSGFGMTFNVREVTSQRRRHVYGRYTQFLLMLFGYDVVLVGYDVVFVDYGVVVVYDVVVDGYDVVVVGYDVVVVGYDVVFLLVMMLLFLL